MALIDSSDSDFKEFEEEYNETNFEGRKASKKIDITDKTFDDEYFNSDIAFDPKR